MCIPVTLDGALDVIAAGNVRAVDAGEVNGRLFVNNSSIGIYPFLVDQRDAEQKQRKVGKWVALVPALFRTLRSASWHRITLATDEGPESAAQGTRRWAGAAMTAGRSLRRRCGRCSPSIWTVR